MILEENEQEEIDKATSILSMVNEIELYSLLLKIKHSDNRESVIDEALKLSRFKLENAWNIDKKSLDEIDECYV